MRSSKQLRQTKGVDALLKPKTIGRHLFDTDHSMTLVVVWARARAGPATFQTVTQAPG